MQSYLAIPTLVAFFKGKDHKFAAMNISYIYMCIFIYISMIQYLCIYIFLCIHIRDEDIRSMDDC